MSRTSALRSYDCLARMQLRLLNQLGDVMNLSPDDRRRALDLDDSAWRAWNEFLACQRPRPSVPVLPDMLLRVARVSFNLVLVADLRGGTDRG